MIPKILGYNQLVLKEFGYFKFGDNLAVFCSEIVSVCLCVID